MCGINGVSQTYYGGQEPDEVNTNAIKGLIQIITFDLLPQHSYLYFWTRFLKYDTSALMWQTAQFSKSLPQRYQIHTSYS
jgi:hypothetical protein